MLNKKGEVSIKGLSPELNASLHVFVKIFTALK